MRYSNEPDERTLTLWRTAKVPRRRSATIGTSSRSMEWDNELKPVRFGP